MHYDKQEMNDKFNKNRQKNKNNKNNSPRNKNGKYVLGYQMQRHVP